MDEHGRLYDDPRKAARLAAGTPAPVQHPDDTVAFVTVRLHANGMLTTQGHVGDRAFAVALLTNAIDAIRSQVQERDKLVVPARDVEAPQSPEFPTRERGDIPRNERGDT